MFTIGTPTISDTDNFSDVSLDRDGTSDTASAVVETTSSFYSPLAELDSMGNLQNIPSIPALDLNQDQQQIDANLNPITAALAQLPNAASTVFSTFSSIIKGASSHSKLDEYQSNSSGLPTNFPQDISDPVEYIGGYASSFDANAPPPVFFSPTDDSLYKKQPAEPATTNTFRLGGAKKKTYAHIPGLSSGQQMPVATPPFNQNSFMPPMPSQSENAMEPNHRYQDSPPAMRSYPTQQKEPEKSSMFSLTSLLTSQLLEKIPSTKNLFSTSEAVSNYDQQRLNHDQDFDVLTSNHDQPPQSAGNFFNIPQSSVGLSQPEQQQLAPQASSPVISFFNPQQFNTAPFTRLKSDQSETIPHDLFADLTRTPDVTTPPTQGNFHPDQNSTPYNIAPSKPPKIDATSAETNCSRPTFFNPVETDLFKAPQIYDEKPRNPYSSNRLSRGVGLYKTRQANENANVLQGLMPPFQETTNSLQSTLLHLPLSSAPVEHQKIPQMPPSNPPSNDDFNQPELHSDTLDKNSNATFPPFVQQAATLSAKTTESLFFNAPLPETDQSSFNVFQEHLQPPCRKKSDLNVPEDKNSGPSFNFFQSQPGEQLSIATSAVGDFSQINFFQQEPNQGGSVKSDSDCTISAPHNFFSNDLPVVSQTNVSSSLANLSTQAVYNDTNINDTISDKLDSLSMSENIGSQLSLFATSELDSSFAQKQSVPPESLIPKFLEASSANTPRTTANPAPSKNYRPVYRHWFYQNLYWHPFSMCDSLAIDEAISRGNEIVVTDGGRFEVNINDKRRSPVYWMSGSNPIRRCSWFYKNPNDNENNLIPFDEATAVFMESEYEKAVTNNSWCHQLSLPNTDDYLKMNDPILIEYYQLGQKLVVKRGVDEFVIDDGEEGAVDHLIISVSNFGDKIDYSGKIY